MYVTDNRASDDCNSIAIITFVVTFIVTLIVTAIITFIVTYICVKRIFESTDKPNNQLLQEKVLYEKVSSSSHTRTITKNDLELQPNPAYRTGNKVIMDTNPAYESHK